MENTMSIRYPKSTTLAQEGADRLRDVMRTSCIPTRANGESRQEYYMRVAAEFYTTPEKVQELLESSIYD